MKLQNRHFIVEINGNTGATDMIANPADQINWIINDSNFGLVDGFRTKLIEETADSVTIIYLNSERNLEMKVEKRLSEDKYIEAYHITNKNIADFFLTKENFAIPLPFDCLYHPKRDVLNDCCISHVWCGGDSAWLYSVRCNGETPYLCMNVTRGAIDDYSIHNDLSRVPNASFYRGTIALHPRETVIVSGQTLTLEFEYRFSDETPEKSKLGEGAIRFTANKYTVNKNEKISLLFESADKWDGLKIACNNVVIPYEKDNDNAYATCSFKSYGERKITASVNGKTTPIYVNVIPEISEILQKRAEFIVNKQQYHCDGSHLDGAYLIYDNETGRLHYDDTHPDHNAARERIGMGVLVCKALGEKYDENLMNSLRAHREFIEREIFDEDTGMVYSEVGKNKNNRIRIYNFPWLSTYYLEWYLLTKEKKCLLHSVKIMLKYFTFGDALSGAQCIEAVKLCEALLEAGEVDLYNSFKAEFLKCADYLTGKLGIPEDSPETSYVSELPNEKLSYLSQAYILTKEERYLERAHVEFMRTKAFFGHQPDFHLNCINVRYWDRYWFGKVPSYGDIFPHYWSALAGWAMNWYDKACNADTAKRLIKNNLTGNLCVYREDGSAANNYLYPYKVIQTNTNPSEYLKPGVFYGKNYDAWANDQDWALYYAASILL